MDLTPLIKEMERINAGTGALARDACIEAVQRFFGLGDWKRKHIKDLVGEDQEHVVS